MPQHNWTPDPSDTMSLAAIRWFACTLESTAIELYATDRTAFLKIEKALTQALDKLAHMKLKKPILDEECPEGYKLCGGLCRPACYEDEAVTPRGGGPKKGSL